MQHEAYSNCHRIIDRGVSVYFQGRIKQRTNGYILVSDRNGDERKVFQYRRTALHPDTEQRIERQFMSYPAPYDPDNCQCIQFPDTSYRRKTLTNVPPTEYGHNLPDFCHFVCLSNPPNFHSLLPHGAACLRIAETYYLISCELMIYR